MLQWMPVDPAFVWDTGRSAPRAPGRTFRVRSSSPGEPGRAPRPAAAETPAPSRAEPEAVLVPLDEWHRILRQLGNLHDAGQQLAEARERAARAETEATFLRERIRELRGRAEPENPAVPEEPASAPPFWVWATRRWIDRRSRRG